MDNAPGHNAILKQFLTDKPIPVLDNPFYSPDLVSVTSNVLKNKNALKGTRFKSVEEAN